MNLTGLKVGDKVLLRKGYIVVVKYTDYSTIYPIGFDWGYGEYFVDSEGKSCFGDDNYDIIGFTKDHYLHEAAPDLLAALKMFVAEYEGNGNDERELRPEMIAARAAIAKAEKE